MITGEVKNKRDSLWDAMWSNQMANPWIAECVNIDVAHKEDIYEIHQIIPELSFKKSSAA